jgi:transcriptional regulator with XRE-family HTH domain
MRIFERPLVSSKLEQGRRAGGETQEALGRRSNVSPALISRFECGWARPTPTMAARLGAALNLPPSELLEPADLSKGV